VSAAATHPTMSSVTRARVCVCVCVCALCECRYDAGADIQDLEHDASSFHGGGVHPDMFNVSAAHTLACAGARRRLQRLPL
jgi:hypothetical protein